MRLPDSTPAYVCGFLAVSVALLMVGESVARRFRGTTLDWRRLSGRWDDLGFERHPLYIPAVFCALLALFAACFYFEPITDWIGHRNFAR